MVKKSNVTDSIMISISVHFVQYATHILKCSIHITQLLVYGKLLYEEWFIIVWHYTYICCILAWFYWSNYTICYYSNHFSSKTSMFIFKKDVIAYSITINIHWININAMKCLKKRVLLLVAKEKVPIATVVMEMYLILNSLEYLSICNA